MPTYRKVIIKNPSNHKVKDHERKSKSGKKTLKQRVKNFFKIPEEVFEEEPSPQFERINLFPLNKATIFLGILAFMIIVNALVGFDINFLYLRQILGFLFLVSVPGLLIMLCFKIKNTGFWEYLVYTVGLSISFIMFAGLAVNWILPWLNITDKPLSLWPILISFDIFLLALWAVALMRNQDLKPKYFTVPKLDRLNNIFFIIPMIFPVLSILGAFLLNNHGPNFLTMIMLGGIAVYVLMLTIYRKKLDKNIWPWALYWMGLSLVSMESLRGWFISATDGTLEYGIANFFINLGHYSYGLLPGNYSAMLSVSLLPGIFSFISSIYLTLVLKLFFPIIFSLLFVCVFFISRKILIPFYSFLATLFFMFQPTLANWIRFPPRQEIAFIFLALIFLIYLNDKIDYKTKFGLLLILGFSLVVSHYSTTVVFLLCLVLVIFSRLIFSKIHKKFNIKTFSLLFTVLLILFSFLWYSQITNTSDSFVSFGISSVSNFGKILNSEVYSAGNSPIEQISLFHPDKLNPASDLHDYLDSFNNSDSFQKSWDYPSRIASGSNKPSLNNSLLNLSSGFRAVIILLSKLFLLGGLFLFFLFTKNHLKLKGEIYVTGLIIFLVFFVLSIIPFASKSYNVDRLYVQVLIILSPISLWGLVRVFRNRSILIYFYISFLILFLFSSVWFLNSIIGGNNLSLSLVNAGNEYDTLYTSKLDIVSGSWMGLINNPKTIFADNFARYKIYQSDSNFNRNSINQDVLPPTIGITSLVYSDSTNKLQEISFKYFGRGLIIYNFPKNFLQDNKNKIYNNGGSEIFR